MEIGAGLSRLSHPEGEVRREKGMLTRAALRAPYGAVSVGRGYYRRVSCFARLARLVAFDGPLFAPLVSKEIGDPRCFYWSLYPINQSAALPPHHAGVSKAERNGKEQCRIPGGLKVLKSQAGHSQPLLYKHFSSP